MGLNTCGVDIRVCLQQAWSSFCEQGGIAGPPRSPDDGDDESTWLPLEQCRCLSSVSYRIQNTWLLSGVLSHQTRRLGHSAGDGGRPNDEEGNEGGLERDRSG